ncbi:DUF2844 domain-containing protein [Trinickia violacea]|uniref:DUF2844 domain-containing protein n=1 Tax=Trinickia violacea TaxID=2571746 RepID=A0A4V1EIC1_9BURK|nr:DUF2844 domain-containing protein [Trinickia violacea]QCP53250.1 DUF2844 domain-containing protein [Trinickia violacea]
MRITRIAACAATVAFCFTSTAYAALGGSPSTPANLHPTASASVATQAGSGYSVNVTTFSDGLVVREYVANGAVFGVSWSGPSMPDLTVLFGSYYAPLQQGASDYRKANGGLSMVIVNQAGLVAQVGGRAGAFSGHAYLPNALPSGVAASAIQ